jgi:hypothetical protein
MTWFRKKWWRENKSILGFAVVQFPLFIVFLFEGIQSNDHFDIIFCGLVVAILAIVWPWQMARFLKEYGRTRLWIGPMILPTLVMVYAFMMKWRFIGTVMWFFAILVPLLLVAFTEPPPATQPQNAIPHERPEKD